MSQPLDAIRVVEVGQWGFVPAAGAILADWGADVVKVEHPVQGDPMRGLASSGLVPTAGTDGINVMWEIPNRGKRSIGIDLSRNGGRELLYRLAAACDVFLTSFLPGVRQKLGIDVEHIRAVNADIVYARGSGYGPGGPDADRGGYDRAAYWARGGPAASMTPVGGDPPGMPGNAFGDLTSAVAVAAGIAGALVRRERTGEGSVVDVSLLGMAMWSMAPSIVGSKLFGDAGAQGNQTRESAPNPVVQTYRTRDGRHVVLVFLQSDRHWPELCARIDRPELVGDERFATAAQRSANRLECMAILDKEFAKRTLDEWRIALDGMDGVWAAVQTGAELPDDPQVIANGYVRDITTGAGSTVPVVASPVQFDEAQPNLVQAPEHGQHTEEVLLDIGLGWDEIVRRKEAGDVL